MGSNSSERRRSRRFAESESRSLTPCDSDVDNNPLICDLKNIVGIHDDPDANARTKAGVDRRLRMEVKRSMFKDRFDFSDSDVAECRDLSARRNNDKPNMVVVGM